VRSTQRWRSLSWGGCRDACSQDCCRGWGCRWLSAAGVDFESALRHFELGPDGADDCSQRACDVRICGGNHSLHPSGFDFANGGLANGIADLPRLRLALPSDPLRSLGPGQHGQIVRQAWEPTTQQASRPIQTVAGWEYRLSPGPAAGGPLVMIRAGIPRRSTPGTYVPYCVPRPTQRKGCRIG